MTPLCSSATGDLVGWATGRTDCDGDVTLEYFNTSGASAGTTLPAGWQVCSADTATQVLTQAAYDAIVTKNPNTLYIIIG